MVETSHVTLVQGGYLNAQFDAGPKGSPVLLLSNSVFTDLSIWHGQIAALTEFVSVLRYDQRGHGSSGPAHGEMSFDDYGADVLAILDAFEIDRCIFVGLSMGVPSGLAAFAHAPERFQAFVAVDGVAKSAEGREVFWRDLRETARASGLTDLSKSIAGRWLPGEAADAQVVSDLANMIAATPVEGFASASFALQNYDYSSVLSDISAPFLAVVGADDGAMPEAMRRQFGTIPNFQIEVIENAGHVPCFQRPKAFNAALLDFLRTIA